MIDSDKILIGNLELMAKAFKKAGRGSSAAVVHNAAVRIAQLNQGLDMVPPERLPLWRRIVDTIAGRK